MGGTVPRSVPSIVTPVNTESSRTPGPLRWAVRLLRGEAVALGVLAVFLVAQALLATDVSVNSVGFLTAFAAGGSAALWGMAAALVRRKAAARAPAIVLHLLMLPIGYYMVQGGLAWSGIPLAALGLLVCTLLVSAPTTRALGLG